MNEAALWVCRRPVARGDIALFADEQGLELVGDPPWTGGVRQSTWADDDAQLTFAAHAPSGAGLFVVAAPNDDLARALQARFDVVSPEAVRRQAEAAVGRRAIIAGLYAVGALMLATHRPPRDEVACLCRRLFDDDRHVRFAAARILRGWPRPEVIDAIGEAAKLHPELVPLHAHLERQLAAAEAGVLGDDPTDDEDELLRRARAGLSEGKPVRIERATDMLLRERPAHPEGLLLRAHLYAVTEQPLLAWGLLGAAREAIAEEVDLRDEDDTEDLVELATEIQGLSAKLEGATPEDGAGKTAVAWLTRFLDDDEDGALHGMAEALLGSLPAHRPLLCLLTGRHRDDVARLSEAVELASDSPQARFELGTALHAQDPERGDDELREALRLLADGGQRSEAAAQIEAFCGPLPEAEVLATLTPRVYAAKHYQEAGELADALVQADPESATGWQIRANARTFTGRYEEAASLYVEALTALDALFRGDGILLGSDPRPAMHFNRACVLSKLGARDEALEALRRAVRADEQWAQRAVEDDYFGVLLHDETFKRIVAREPRALVTEEDLSQEAVRSLLDQGLALCRGGAVDEALAVTEQAAERAVWGEHGELSLRALALRGRIVALGPEPEAGLASCERAVAELRSTASPEVRSEVLHAHGFALQANHRLEAAEAAHRAAFDATGDDEGGARLARALGGLATLRSMAGDDAAGERLAREAIELIEAHLDGSSAEAQAEVLEEQAEVLEEQAEVPEEQAEALDELTTLRASLGYLLLRKDDWALALGEATAAARGLERLLAIGYQPRAASLDHVAGLLGHLVETACDDASSQAATAVHLRVEGIGLDSRPPVREEQIFWRRLRRFVSRMRREGVSDETLTDAFTRALRGPEELPEALRAVPELGGLAHALAQRALQVPTFLVLAPMALETARVEGQLDQALDQLEGLCLSDVLDGVEG